MNKLCKFSKIITVHIIHLLKQLRNLFISFNLINYRENIWID